MNLLILEDENILLEKYVQYLQPSFECIMTATTYNEAFALIKENEFDIALIDYNLPDGTGLELIKNYPKASDCPVFVMITAYSKEKLAIDSLNLGVFKYIEKPVDKSHLIKTLSASIEESRKRDTFKKLSQKFMISKEVKSILVDDYFITEREIEVLESILINGKNKIVAKNLCISAGTVRNHLSNIFQKLHVEHKEELRLKIEDLNKAIG